MADPESLISGSDGLRRPLKQSVHKNSFTPDGKDKSTPKGNWDNIMSPNFRFGGSFF
jgi:hypothetical protein